MAELGKLEVVDVRSAWAHEAHDFTVWMAEHLEEIGEVVGRELSLIDREVGVGTFSADILARDETTDGLVLIENQLAATDHTHLGQIMTYAAGLEARTIIWIAPVFREPHAAALRWLNEHMPEGFAFFAIQVKVVKIGDSSLAPLFEIIEKPNDWERILQNSAQKSTKASEHGTERYDFWTHFLERHPDSRSYGDATRLNVFWRLHKEWGLVVVLFFNKKRVGVYVRGGYGIPADETYAALQPYSETLEQLLGAPFGRPDQQSFFATRRHENTGDRALWDELSDWLNEIAERYESALTQIFQSE